MTVWTELNGQLAILGGVSGAALLLYFIAMVMLARRKEKALHAVELRLARIEGMLLATRKK